MGRRPVKIAPTATQWRMITAPTDEVLYGGARGGGKTEGMIIAAVLHMQQYGANARCLFLRASFSELEEVIARVQTTYASLGEWSASKRTLSVNGGICRFRFLSSIEDASKYQGHEYTLILADEVGEYRSFDALLLLKGSLRSAAGVPCRMLLSANPLGRQHNRLVERYMTGHVPNQIFRGDDGSKRVYIPSLLKDNPHLLANDPDYLKRLETVGDPERVKAWVNGDWSASLTGGCIDDLWDDHTHIVTPFTKPDGWELALSMDYGTAAPTAILITLEATSDHYTDLTGATHSCMYGDIFVMDEIYTCTSDDTRKGTGADITTISALIKAKERYWGEPLARIADSAIFAKIGTLSVADEFQRAGISLLPCKKGPGSRGAGVLTVRERMRNAIEGKPRGLYIASTCKHCLRVIPRIPRSVDDPSVPSQDEDHLWDALVYRLATPLVVGIGRSTWR